MSGHVKKRCPKPAAAEAGCGKSCGHAWAYWLDLPRGEDGRRRQTSKGGYPTKKAAETALAKAMTEADSGTFTEPSALTLGAYLDAWVDGIDRKPATMEAYRRVITRQLKPTLGGHKLQRLTAVQVKAAYRQLLDGTEDRPGLSPTTVQLVHQVLSKALSDAVGDKLLPANPVATVKAPARDTPEMTTWSREHVVVFLTHVAAERLAAMWRLFLTTGMRRGEVAALRWADVDLDKATLSVRQTGNMIMGVWTVGTPKGRKDASAKTRRLSLDAGTVEALRRHRREQAQERLAWAGDWQGQHDLVFCREDGSPINPPTMGHWLTTRAKRLGLPHVRVHDLRHTYATLALMAGVHPKVVSERLGHANIGITLNLYSHVTEGMDREAADLVAGLFS
jgi:integrase